MSEAERRTLVDWIAENPDGGDLIQGTGGVRKVRFAAPGRGKSGGYRVITFYRSERSPVFLLTVFAKGAKVTLTMAERNGSAKLTSVLIETYSGRPPNTLGERR